MQDKTSIECFENAGELADHLNSLGRDRLLIIDDHGDTYGVPRYLIELWNPADVESPVALYTRYLEQTIPFSSTVIQVWFGKFKFEICADHLDYAQRGRFVAKLASNMGLDIRKVPGMENWTGYDKVAKKRSYHVLIKTIIRTSA